MFYITCTVKVLCLLPLIVSANEEGGEGKEGKGVGGGVEGRRWSGGKAPHVGAYVHVYLRAGRHELFIVLCFLSYCLVAMPSKEKKNTLNLLTGLPLPLPFL